MKMSETYFYHINFWSKDIIVLSANAMMNGFAQILNVQKEVKQEIGTWKGLPTSPKLQQSRLTQPSSNLYQKYTGWGYSCKWDKKKLLRFISIFFGSSYIIIIIGTRLISIVSKTIKIVLFCCCFLVEKKN